MTTMTDPRYVASIVHSSSVFKDDIFNGKVLFCTGGGSGIGKSMAEAVMRHGANAVIVGRNFERLTRSAEELSKATGRRCIPAKADVREPAQLREAVEKAVSSFGRIDFVICGAAGNFLAPISRLSENGFKTVIQIDVMGTYNTIKATLSYLRKTRGSYIQVSTSLHWRATPYQAHVSAAKAGIDALSAVLAVEEGIHGIRSNVLTPGPIGGTEGHDRLYGSSKSPQDGHVLNSTHRTMPLGRVGHFRDVENATVFLFSDAANFITGQILLVDGGNEHLREPFLPYPEYVLDWDAEKKAKPRL